MITDEELKKIEERHVLWTFLENDKTHMVVSLDRENGDNLETCLQSDIPRLLEEIRRLKVLSCDNKPDCGGMISKEVSKSLDEGRKIKAPMPYFGEADE